MDDYIVSFIYGCITGFGIFVFLVACLNAGAEKHRMNLRISAARKRSVWIVGQCRRIA